MDTADLILALELGYRSRSIGATEETGYEESIRTSVWEEIQTDTCQQREEDRAEAERNDREGKRANRRVRGSCTFSRERL